jgi:peptidylprolyl isomerase
MRYFLILSLFLLFSFTFSWNSPLQKPLKKIISHIHVLPLKLSTFILSAAITSSCLLPTDVHAVIAPLADVGVKEFLVKDGSQHLRLSLPAGPEMKLGLGLGLGSASMSSEPGYQVQQAIELIRLRFEQVGNSNPGVWGASLSDANNALSILTKQRQYFVTSAINPSSAAMILDEQVFPDLNNLITSLRAKDVAATTQYQDITAMAIENLRMSHLKPHTLPYKIPEEYQSLPRLAGRAKVEMTVVSKGGGYRLDDGKTVIPEATFVIEVDGYHAPLTAGNFLDLVDKKFYDKMTMQKIEELTVQTGKPSNAEGYIDPKTKSLRTIPLGRLATMRLKCCADFSCLIELFYKQDSEPVYGITSDDDLRATETMVLPFQAYGAVGMARDNEQADSASSQFFLLKWRQALIAPGRNTLDGFYSCFGYIVSHNEYLLSQFTAADTITSMKIVEGYDNLIR